MADWGGNRKHVAGFDDNVGASDQHHRGHGIEETATSNCHSIAIAQNDAGISAAPIDYYTVKTNAGPVVILDTITVLHGQRCRRCVKKPEW